MLQVLGIVLRRKTVSLSVLFYVLLLRREYWLSCTLFPPLCY